MRTEITIPFTFDTTPIEHMLQQIGEDEVRKKVDELVRERVYGAIPKVTDRWSNNNGKPDWKSLVESRTDAFIRENAEAIIDEAAMLLAMRASRKKSWKDTLAEYKEVDE